MANKNIGRGFALGVIILSLGSIGMNLPANYTTEIKPEKEVKFTVDEVFIETNSSDTDNILAGWDPNYDYGARRVDNIYAIDTKGKRHDVSKYYDNNGDLNGIQEDLILPGMVLAEKSEYIEKSAKIYIPVLNRKSKFDPLGQDISDVIIDKSKVDEDAPLGIRLTVKNEGAGHSTFNAHYKKGKVMLLEGDKKQ